MTTFSPPVNPTYGSPRSTEFRIKKADFGDGYSQRVGDGINPNVERWDLQWRNVSNTDADTITDFFDARGGTEDFDWLTPFGDTKAFFVTTYRRTPNGFGTSDITATLEESKNN